MNVTKLSPEFVRSQRSQRSAELAGTKCVELFRRVNYKLKESLMT